LACDHDHVICTMPHERNGLWLANVEVMSRLLCASVPDTLLELLGEANDLGGKPGLIATRPPWSQTLVLHPHGHGLVTGGGLHAAGQWVAVRHGCLLPMRGGMALCRDKRRAAMLQGLQHGQLTPPAGKSRQQLENLLNKLGRQKWHVHSRERSPHGQGVLVYLARSLGGGPLSNLRLRACDGQQVVVGDEERAKGPGGQARQRTMALPLEQFLGRWLLHVPPHHAVLVRCWGLYAHTQGQALAQCRQQMDQGPMEAHKPCEGPREGEAWEPAPPESCPVCGRRLVCTPLLPWAGVPPPAEPRWEQVA
jgi:hypothetical protein